MACVFKVPSVWPPAYGWNVTGSRERQPEFMVELPKVSSYFPLREAKPYYEFLTSTVSSPLGLENKEKRTKGRENEKTSIYLTKYLR